DGYAVIQKDIKDATPENPATLKVVADLPAGYTVERELKKGEVIRIMTGAPIPEGRTRVPLLTFSPAFLILSPLEVALKIST
ncbi:MAG: molybdopterin molybdenumtransferase MoeA, partial [Deltaproteobacteria bacterium]|nr:molybdopterin molybdenumtransferase MoeA [Deltaproteobacteria bacterium]